MTGLANSKHNDPTVTSSQYKALLINNISAFLVRIVAAICAVIPLIPTGVELYAAAALLTHSHAEQMPF